ncbi:folylpolyglutamate synthase [Nocardiopsis sp. RV163]|uniref:folylpolyglutamate synthase n=1 Tax=Nocardiopsis sp. RV163 TaxID=1661388 RepID=UPI00064BC21B|nr:folylpolyglutamate synthase [Nocardiopsis sp. RV163]
MPSLDPFFYEWAQRRPGQTRSLERAAALMRVLDLDAGRPPVLGVVGSKGKGSTATTAAAALSSAGLRTVLVTGPSFRSYRERVRVDGTSVAGGELDALGERIAAARRELSSVEESGGYLAPSGLFLVAGLLRAREVGADVCVLEAGMGGHRDELRLVGPEVVALGRVFAEHVGVLGDTVAQIAREKARVTGERTRALVRLPQTAEAAAAADAALAETTGGRVRAEVVDPDRPGAEPPPGLRPPGLSAASGVLGTAVAARMLDHLGRPPLDRERLHAVLGTVRLPGRLSRHAVPAGAGGASGRLGGTSGGGPVGGGTAPEAEVLVDSAIDRNGVAAALAHARGLWGGVDHVLLCLPDHKDVSGAVEALGDLPVTAVRLPEAHLRFEYALPDRWGRMDAADLSPAALRALGERVLALGTVYFTGRVLEAVDAPTDRLFG